MNIDCFTDFIGIRGEGNAPISGLYINDIPGITKDVLTKLATADDNDDLTTYYSRLQERTAETFIEKVSHVLAKSFQLGKNIEAIETGEYLPTGTSVASFTETGVKIKLFKTKYALITIDTLRFFYDDAIGSPTPTLTITVKDHRGEILDQETINIAAGENIVEWDKTYDTDEIKITYDSTTYQPRKTKKQYLYANYNRVSSISQINDGGIKVNYSVDCSIEKFICVRRSRFKYAFWYWMAREIMDERLVTNETNQYTTISVERAAELEAYYEEKFSKSINAILDDINIQDDHFCFDCNRGVSIRHLLP